MTHTLAAPRAVAAALEAAGIRATIDPRNVNPPCVWVEFGSADRVTRQLVEAETSATVVVPGPPNGDALLALDTLTGAAMAALDAAGLPWSATQLGTTPSPATGELLPALTLTIDTTEEA